MKPSDVERLYVLFGHRVYLRCFHLLREEHAAMDMAQEVYVALLDKLMGFPDDRRAGAWLLKVATNRCLNEIRRRRYWKTRPLVEEFDAGGRNPFAGADERLLFDRLLCTLDRRKASIVTGYFVEGYTLQETAADNGCSVPTVRRAITAFLEKARTRMKEAK